MAPGSDPSSLFAGFDFGTESVRVVIVDRSGQTLGSAVANYAHGQIVRGSQSATKLFDRDLPTLFALQHPLDWLDSAAEACRAALRAGAIDPAEVRGIGVDFTSCTMLPCRADGAPLCLESLDGTLSQLAAKLHAWPKLWKHHGALEQCARMNQIAQARREPWLARYGGAIGLEWLFPKILEVIECAPAIASSVDLWLEAGDWFIWQLLGSPAIGGTIAPTDLPRSTCQAGYKALWSARDGYPSREYLGTVHPALVDVVEHRLPGKHAAPGTRAGALCRTMADRLGLHEGTAVSPAIIDAHAGVPGAGVGEPGAMVMVMGTSGCHMLLAREERLIPGVAGIVRDGILPGFVGYETGQAAMGDAFDLVRRLGGFSDFAALDQAARVIAPGGDGLICLDWFNGCRTPLMDASLTGALVGLTLHHTPAHVYRAVLEGAAFGLRAIVETLRNGGVAIDRFVAIGGLPRKNPLFVEIVASVLDAPVEIHAAEHGPALGAAILGALAAGAEDCGFDDIGEAVDSIAARRSALPAPTRILPDRKLSHTYDRLFSAYQSLAQQMAAMNSPMRKLHEITRKPDGDDLR